MTFSSRPLAFIAAASVLVAAAHSAELLTPGKPIALTGTHGKFDFLNFDAATHRLLAAHAGNNSLDVIDAEKGALVKAIPTGQAQDCAIDAKSHRYLVSVSKPPGLVVVDASTLAVTGTTPVGGPADLLVYDEKSTTAYVTHDDSTHVWAVSPESTR